LFEPDTLSDDVWDDVNKLVELHGSNWDVVYDEHGVARDDPVAFPKLIKNSS
jgi:hypothetical protein